MVSASGHEVVNPIAALLGVDNVNATQMVIADRCTSDFAFYAYGEAKAARIRQPAAERGYELAYSYASSDSITDRRCSRRWVTPPRSNLAGRCGEPRLSRAGRYCPLRPRPAAPGARVPGCPGEFRRSLPRVR